MKIPRATKDSGDSDAAAEYSAKFPDWELPVESLTDYIFGPSVGYIWETIPESFFRRAVETGKPLSLDDVLRAIFYKNGKWTAHGIVFKSKEDLLAARGWDVFAPSGSIPLLCESTREYEP